MPDPSAIIPAMPPTLTLKETLKHLKSLGNEKVRAQNTKRGAGDNQFGVGLGDIRGLAKKIKADHKLAMALWESLSDAEREGELELTDELGAELDRRWAEHLANPSSAVPWSEVRRKLLGRG